MTQHQDILIIGGGVIGVCTAYELARQGRSITVVDKADICAGSSYGNVGWIANGHAIPIAAPGVLTQGLKWLLDSGSPFYIKPRLDADLLRWLWQFRGACSKERMIRGIPVLLALSRGSSELFEQLAADAEQDFGFERKGLLHLFTEPHSFEKAVKEADLLREFGVETIPLDADGLRQIEPNVLPAVTHGLYYPDYAHMIPDKFVQAVAHLAERRSVCFRPNTEVLGFETSGGQITAVDTTRGAFKAGQLVLAAGAWSPGLMRGLGLRLPVQPAKGYSLTFKRPPDGPRLPLSLDAHKVAVTPMGDMLRFSSTLELAGLDPTINRRRLAATRQAALEYLPNADQLELLEIWRGFRPASSDGLPIIGRSGSIRNLILATGHGMLGMTHGPITGKLVAQIIAGEPPEFDISALAPTRFS
jgi:D-amino-acid dehydrogenase